MRHYHTCLFAALLGAIVCDGCHRIPVPDGFPPVYPCTIILTQEGKPLEDAEVILFSGDEDFPWAVGGTTDSDGAAALRTHGRFNGVPVGDYIVTVTKTESENTGQGEIRTKPILVYTFVDKTYVNPDTSPLKISVEKKGRNRFEFDLGPAMRKLYETISPSGA